MTLRRAATCLIALASVCGAAAPTIQVRIFGDHGRHQALVQGLAQGTPGLEAAVGQLLSCLVERMPSGWLRCRERNLVEGLEVAGALDFAPLLAMPGMAGVTASVSLPVSPHSTVNGLARQPASGWWLRPIEFTGPAPASAPWRTGFYWQSVAADLAVLPFLLYWLIRRPEPRWAFAAALSVWLAWLVSSRTIDLDHFFYLVPSVEGAFLRWISSLPFWLLVVAQSRWLRMPWGAAVWIQIGALVALHPRSAEWMSFSELVLADVVTIALLVLVAGRLGLSGADGAALPESMLMALRRREPRTAEMDLRLDRTALDQTPKPRLGKMVTVPAAWFDRLKGPPLEAAALLAIYRAMHAPVARMFAFLIGVWILFRLPAQRLPWLIVLAPLVVCAGVALAERRWERAIAARVRRAGGEPAHWLEALNTIRPEWGESAVRIAVKLTP